MWPFKKKQKYYVYLIHFSEKLHHAGHYLGFSKHLWWRIQSHKTNQGAKLLRALNKAGIGWEVVRTWEVDSQHYERKLKNMHNSPQLCPICHPELQPVDNYYAELLEENSVFDPNNPLPW